jgi:large subunit ribosomal protein L25
MQVARLKAEVRSALGRAEVKTLRAQGWLPAVVYGEGKDPQSISISEWELEQHIKHHHRVYSLEIDGSKQDAYLQDVQHDSLSDRLRHVDFKRIDLTKPIEIEVEVTFVGHPVGLGKGGVLIKDHPLIKVRCLPTAIPEELEATIGHLEIDQSLQAKEVPLPQGVQLAVPPEFVVCHVAKLVVQVVAAPAAPVAEGAPAAEGAAPAAGAAGEKAAEKPAEKGKDGGKEGKDKK